MPTPNPPVTTVPGIDADVEHQWRTGHALDAFAETRRASDHFECGTQRAFRIVLMRDRRAEQSQQRIADELVDETAEALHGRGQLLEKLVLQCLHDLGVEPLAERGEPAEIGEQYRHSPAVRVCGSRRRRRVRSPRIKPARRRCGGGFCLGACTASRAEGEVRRAEKAAAGAACRLARAALRQKAKPLSILKPQSAQSIEQDLAGRRSTVPNSLQRSFTRVNR